MRDVLACDRIELWVTKATAVVRFVAICGGVAFVVAIPRKSNEKHRGKFDKSIYQTRNVVERCFNRSLVSSDCNPVREKSRKLPRQADSSLYPTVAIVLKQTLVLEKAFLPFN